VLIKNIACGVCHTDLHAAHGGEKDIFVYLSQFVFFLSLFRIDWDNKPELPRIPGHEGIGEIIELGSMVGNHLKKG
jgi:propanol-preferring alcohol dehydrogenase